MQVGIPDAQGLLNPQGLLRGDRAADSHGTMPLARLRRHII